MMAGMYALCMICGERGIHVHEIRQWPQYVPLERQVDEDGKEKRPRVVLGDDGAPSSTSARDPLS